MTVVRRWSIGKDYETETVCGDLLRHLRERIKACLACPAVTTVKERHFQRQAATFAPMIDSKAVEAYRGSWRNSSGIGRRQSTKSKGMEYSTVRAVIFACRNAGPPESHTRPDGGVLLYAPRLLRTSATRGRWDTVGSAVPERVSRRRCLA